MRPGNTGVTLENVTFIRYAAMDATTKDLRLHTRELIAATERGEEVIITFHGRRRAKLVPWNHEGDVPRKGPNPAFGLWRDDKQPVEEQVRAWRKGRQFE